MMTVDPIKQAYYIKAPISEVFDAISDSQTLARWFLKSAEIEHKKGGKYSFAWLGVDFKQDGNVLDFKEDKKLVIDWASAGEDSVVTFTTKKEGADTLLTLVHSGFRDNERRYMSLAGWTYYLMNLKSVLENGKDLRHKKDNIMGK